MHTEPMESQVLNITSPKQNILNADEVLKFVVPPNNLPDIVRSELILDNTSTISDGSTSENSPAGSGVVSISEEAIPDVHDAIEITNSEVEASLISQSSQQPKPEKMNTELMDLKELDITGTKLNNPEAGEELNKFPGRVGSELILDNTSTISDDSTLENPPSSSGMVAISVRSASIDGGTVETSNEEPELQASFTRRVLSHSNYVLSSKAVRRNARQISKASGKNSRYPLSLRSFYTNLYSFLRSDEEKPVLQCWTEIRFVDTDNNHERRFFLSPKVEDPLILRGKYKYLNQIEEAVMRSIPSLPNDFDQGMFGRTFRPLRTKFPRKANLINGFLICAKHLKITGRLIKEPKAIMTLFPGFYSCGVERALIGLEVSPL